MMRPRLILILTAVLALGACSNDGLCGEGAGQSSVRLEADALAQPGSRLVVCINDDCNDGNDESSTWVAVHYALGVHPDFANWSVERVTGGTWETIAGGHVGLACTRESSAVRIVVDGNGEATVTRS